MVLIYGAKMVLAQITHVVISKSNYPCAVSISYNTPHLLISGSISWSFFMIWVSTRWR